MKWSVTPSARERITGAIFLVDVPGEPEPVGLVCARPDPRQRRDVLKDLQILTYDVRRWQDQRQRYLEGELDEPPREVWTDAHARPVLDFVRAHVMDVRGVEFADADGAPVGWEQLTREQRTDFLEVILDGLRLVNAASTIAQSNGLGPLREALEAWATIEYEHDGCPCPACTSDGDRSPECLHTDHLDYLPGILWLVEQHALVMGGGAQRPGADTPAWLEDVDRVILTARARRKQREDEERKQREIMERHFGKAG